MSPTLIVIVVILSSFMIACEAPHQEHPEWAAYLNIDGEWKRAERYDLACEQKDREIRETLRALSKAGGKSVGIARKEFQMTILDTGNGPDVDLQCVPWD